MPTVTPSRSPTGRRAPAHGRDGPVAHRDGRPRPAAGSRADAVRAGERTTPRVGHGQPRVPAADGRTVEAPPGSETRSEAVPGHPQVQGRQPAPLRPGTGRAISQPPGTAGPEATRSPQPVDAPVRRSARRRRTTRRWSVSSDAGSAAGRATTDAAARKAAQAGRGPPADDRPVHSPATRTPIAWVAECDPSRR